MLIQKFWRSVLLPGYFLLLVGTATNIASAGLLEGLVGYYDFQQVAVSGGLNNKAASIGSTYTGPGININATIVGSGVTTGFAGNAAYNFTGAGNPTNRSTLLAGNSANLSGVTTGTLNTLIGTDDIGTSFSLGLWAYSAIDPDTVLTRRFLFEGSDNFNISLGTDANSSSATNPLSSGYYFNGTYSGALNILPNSWQHVVYSANNNGNGTSTYSIYLNGNLVESETLTGASSFPGLNIGNARTGSNRPWDGMIDEVVIYNRALSGAEVTQLQSLGVAGSPVPEPGTWAIIAMSAIGLLGWKRHGKN